MALCGLLRALSSRTAEFPEDEFHKIQDINLSILGRGIAGTGIFLCVTGKFPHPNFTHPNFTHLLHSTRPDRFFSDLQELVFPVMILNPAHLQRKNAKYF